MTAKAIKFGLWEVRCNAEDGGRLESLSFDGFEMLTIRPEIFTVPDIEFGAYEQRPVFGYDDCFPTVDVCQIDGLNFSDHGELWQKPFVVRQSDGRLDFETKCEKFDIRFRRSMIFAEKSLQWKFEVTNQTENEVDFLHVMHPLMPLARVAKLTLPECRTSNDIFNQHGLDLSSAAISEYLFDVKDSAAEVMLEEISDGQFTVEFDNGMKVRVDFPVKKFPCLNIWWNNSGYPKNSERCEFAVEPICGPSGNLAELVSQRRAMWIGAKDTSSWVVDWTIF